MTTVRVPTPLRPYTGGAKEVEVSGGTVGEVLADLVRHYPDLKRHLFEDAGTLRAYVNVFVNDEDVRSLQGDGTPLQAGDRLMIIPSIAGGALGTVDHSALRVNQASIIALLVLAFIVDFPWLVAGVCALMLIGTVRGHTGFAWLYQGLRRLSWVRPDPLPDAAEPHRFSQGFGGVVLLLALAGFALRATTTGWVLVWVVVALAAVNLFAGFCVGCALYYWLQRLGVPGFRATPPPGTVPGMRPQGHP